MSTTNVRDITLVPLIALDTDVQMQVREIRNEDNVRKWMYTDHVIGANEHLQWIHQLKHCDQQLVFVVVDAGQEPLGVVSANNIERDQKTIDWAFYLTESARGGLGSALEYAFIEFVFNQLGMEKLNCEVIEGNDAVVKQHKKFLFQEEGFKRSNIEKDGARLGVHCLGLTKAEWFAGRESIYQQYQNVFAKFRVSIEWQADELEPLHPIDQIEAARAKNNLNWMSILRLSLEKHPETAGPIVAEIKRIDREISALTDKLIGDDG